MNNNSIDEFENDLPFSPYVNDDFKEEKNSTVEETILSNDIFHEIEKEDEKNNLFDNIKEVISNNIKILPVIAFTFVSFLGIYIFINNVNADSINLIKIEKNTKVGYIDNDGNVIVKPKYLYGTNFYKGYSIVKNYNSLYGILDGKGENKIAFGNIFSASLYDDRYVVSKFTNEGLKMGLLDENLNEVTRFNYDNIAYSKSGVFIFTKNETMGIMNKDGKEIYKYKVDEIDDRNISVEISNVTDESMQDLYAKVKINLSSTIINIKTGKEVYKYTLDEINVLDNNVFYIRKEDSDNKYFVIKDDKIVYESNDYKKIRIENIDSNIAIAIKDDASIDYINLLTKKKINEDENIKYTYSDGVILEEKYNFISKKNEYEVNTPNEVISTFSDVKPVDNKYVNNFMKISTSNDKYNFVNKNGDIISKKEYENVDDFNKNGFAIVSNDNQYGIINKKGKEIVSTKYEEIVLLDEELFSNVKKINKQELFIFKQNDKYGIINSNGKIVIKPIYNNFEIITTKYPIIKATYNNDDVLINLQTFKDLTIDIKKDVEVYDNYIVSSNNYYNYDGDLIYSIGG